MVGLVLRAPVPPASSGLLARAPGRPVGCAAIALLSRQGRPLPRLVIGFALVLSSTAIVVPVLAERKSLNSGGGRSFAVPLFQIWRSRRCFFAVADPCRPRATRRRARPAALTVGARRAGLAPRAPAVCVLGLVSSVATTTSSTEFFMATCLLVGHRWSRRRAVCPCRSGFHRRAAARRDRIPARDRGDDRAPSRGCSSGPSSFPSALA